MFFAVLFWAAAPTPPRTSVFYTVFLFFFSTAKTYCFCLLFYLLTICNLLFYL